MEVENSRNVYNNWGITYYVPGATILPPLQTVHRQHTFVFGLLCG